MMVARDITTPHELVAAWEAGDITAWDAIAVVMHLVDRSNVVRWVMALPIDLQGHLLDEATRFGMPGPSVALGSGAGLDENPAARQALRDWLRSATDMGRWLPPRTVAHVTPATELPGRFVARDGNESEDCCLAVELWAGSDGLASIEVLSGSASLVRDARLPLWVGGERVAEMVVVVASPRPASGESVAVEQDFLCDMSVPPKLPKAA